jgi:endonuclease/exonuclease/phosphatase family metal-dependent hydrolase
MDITIISFNIWDLPLWFVKNRAQRIARVADYLASSHADIVCLQESWDRTTRLAVIETMKKAGYSFAGAQDVSGILGNSGLITFSKFPICSKKFTGFSWLVSAFVEMFSSKGVLETMIETPRGLIRVLNTHLHMPSWFFDQRVRLMQLNSLMETIHAEDEVPTVLAGDFNEHDLMRSPEFAEMISSGQFTHPFHPQEAAPTYRKENEFVDSWINRMDESKRFDYIFVRALEKIGLQVKKYAPVYTEVALSDHDPVMMSLGLLGETA